MNRSSTPFSNSWLLIIFVVLLAALTSTPGQEPPPDTDGDGIPDTLDVCPAVSDPGQANTDPLFTNSVGEQFASLFCPNSRLGTDTCPANAPIYTGRGPFAVAAADFDKDGWPDVAVAPRFDDRCRTTGIPCSSDAVCGGAAGSCNTADRIWIHYNNQNLQFGTRINRNGPIFRGTIGLEDFNGNGLLDGVCAGTTILCTNDQVCGGEAGSCQLLGVGEDVIIPNGFLDKDDPRTTQVEDSDENLGCTDTDPRTPCQVTFLDTPGDLRGIVASDFNNDGKADIAALSFTTSSVLVFLGNGTVNGSATFQPSRSYAAGQSPRELISADFNLDGLEDLAVANFKNTTSAVDKVTILLANADGSFRGAPVVTAGPGTLSVASGDLNQDGRPDLAILNFGITGQVDTQSVTLALGRGDGTFEVLPVRARATTEPFHISVGQANSRIDSFPDILTVSVNRSGALLLFGLGNGTFFQNPGGIDFIPQGLGGTSTPGPRFCAIADLSTDQVAELVIANFRQGDVVVALGGGTLPVSATSLGQVSSSGPGFFPTLPYSTASFPLSTPLASNGPRAFVLTDLDRSASLDLVVANLDANTLNVMTSAGDGAGDACDNCRFLSNQDQIDSPDLDGRGNRCDPDDDNDIIPDTVEPGICNPANLSACLDPLERDFDGDDPERHDEEGNLIDSSGDGREILFLGSDPFVADTDGDGCNDGIDSCPGLPTTPDCSGLLDTDGDGLANLCDFDDDNDDLPDTAEPGLGLDPLGVDFDADEVKDGADNCPMVKNGFCIGKDPVSDVARCDTNGNETLEAIESRQGLQRDTDLDSLGDACDSDIDNDTLPNTQEEALGTDPFELDTDEDGLTDSEEISRVCPTNPTELCPTDPIDADTDGDNVKDGTEVSDTLTDPLVRDSDGDGVDDLADNCPFTPNPSPEDLDHDGVLDPGTCSPGSEVCFTAADCPGTGDSCEGSEDADGNGILSQPDLDADGIGNICDDDRDGDGLLNDFELFGIPGIFDQPCDLFDPTKCLSPDDPDFDDDGILDGRDFWGFNAAFSDDADGDGLLDGDDNCVRIPNLDQEDLEGRGPDRTCAVTAGGFDGDCGTTADNTPEMFGPDGLCGGSDDLLPTAMGVDDFCGSEPGAPEGAAADNNLLFYGPDLVCKGVGSKGLDGQCSTPDDRNDLYGPDGTCGTNDDRLNDDIWPAAPGPDGKCFRRGFTPNDDNRNLYGADDLCGGPKGDDGECRTADDESRLYGPDEKCGDADGDDGVCGTADDEPGLYGPDEICGTTDDKPVDDRSNDDPILGDNINVDNDPLNFGPDEICGTSDDIAGDGLGDACEREQYSSDVTSVDTDGDGFTDGDEVFVLGDPVPLLGVLPLDLNSNDSDADGLCDDVEIAGPTSALFDDTDGDGDLDGDGASETLFDGPKPIDITDPLYDCRTSASPRIPADNCPVIPNPNQADLDGDKIGDACDEDQDGDGLSNEAELKVFLLDPRDPDNDDDGSNDFEEIFVQRTNPRVADTDFDGAMDGPDNCPLTPNGTQTDFDHDGVGDACDCAPFDAQLSSPPGEARNAKAIFPDEAAREAGRMLLSWDAPAEAVGTLRYDVVRGRISDLRASRTFAAAECVSDSQDALGAIDNQEPPVGEVFYYLIRAETTCGGGSYGTRTDGVVRSIAACEGP